MKRHPFSLESLAFGLFFLAVIGQWAVWRAEILSPDQLAYLAAGSLIVLGVIGILASLAKPKSSAHEPIQETEIPDDEEIDPQS